METHKACPECGGEGDICINCDGDCYEGANRLCEYAGEEGHDCDLCAGSGIIPIFYTPEQYKEVTGHTYPEGAPVWFLVTQEDGYVLDEPHWELALHVEVELIENLIIANEAGKPPVDYKVEG